jgi:hypothetical protein
VPDRREKAYYPYVMALGCLLLTALGSLVFLAASYHNYPGGKAFARFHQITAVHG